MDASYAASATQEVNLTVKHITDDEVVWEETLTHDIEIGQKLTTEVSTGDDLSDFEVTEIPTNQFGYTRSYFAIFSMFSFVLITLMIARRRKRFF